MNEEQLTSALLSILHDAPKREAPRARELRSRLLGEVRSTYRELVDARRLVSTGIIPGEPVARAMLAFAGALSVTTLVGPELARGVARRLLSVLGDDLIPLMAVCIEQTAREG